MSYGDVIDLTTNQKIGVWQAFTVSTADEDLGPGIIVGTISNLVIELGPQGDDSLTIAGEVLIGERLGGSLVLSASLQHSKHGDRPSSKGHHYFIYKNMNVLVNSLEI